MSEAVAPCDVTAAGFQCALPLGHWGFHKSLGAMEVEYQMTPEECEELERERWEARRAMDAGKI